MSPRPTEAIDRRSNNGRLQKRQNSRACLSQKPTVVLLTVNGTEFRVVSYRSVSGKFSPFRPYRRGRSLAYRPNRAAAITADVKAGIGPIKNKEPNDTLKLQNSKKNCVGALGFHGKLCAFRFGSCINSKIYRPRRTRKQCVIFIMPLCSVQPRFSNSIPLIKSRYRDQALKRTTFAALACTKKLLRT